MSNDHGILKPGTKINREREIKEGPSEEVAKVEKVGK